MVNYPKSVEAIQESVREQIQELRSYIVDLRPPILDQLGLEKSLHSYMESYREKHPDLAVRMELHPIGAKLSEAQSVALFRIFQEALLNISKHAGTKNIQVKVTLKDEGQGVDWKSRITAKGLISPINGLILHKQGIWEYWGCGSGLRRLGDNWRSNPAKGKERGLWQLFH
jgi:signal transduction histidine kinase